VLVRHAPSEKQVFFVQPKKVSAWTLCDSHKHVRSPARFALHFYMAKEKQPSYPSLQEGRASGEIGHGGSHTRGPLQTHPNYTDYTIEPAPLATSQSGFPFWCSWLRPGFRPRGRGFDSRLCLGAWARRFNLYHSV
jgi:hypothetical protein